MKPLLIAVLLAIMQAPSPVPGQAADTHASGSKSVKKHAQGEKTPAAETMPVPEPPGTHKGQQETGSVAADNADQAISIRELPPMSVRRDWIDWLAVGFTGALVIVGGLGIRYAVKTLMAIKRQADLMERQTGILEQSVKAAEDNAAAAKASAEAASKGIDLQKAAQQQWLVFGNWRTVRIALEGSYEMGVQFDIENASSWPVSLLRSALRVGGRLRGYAVSWRAHGILLAPHVPCTVDITVPLTAEQDQSYLSSSLVLWVAGFFYYTNMFAQQQSQRLSGKLTCTKKGAIFAMEWLPDDYDPKEPEQQDGEKAN